MNREFTLPEGSRLRKAVETICAEPLPEDAIARVQQRAVKLQVLTIPPRKWRQALMGIAGVAAVVLIAVFLVRTASTPTATDVADAVITQPWLLAHGVSPAGEHVEIWFSAPHGVIAMKIGEETIFIDRQKQSIELFAQPGAPEKLVDRFPFEPVGPEGIASQRTAFHGLLSGDLVRAVTTGTERVIGHDQKSISKRGRKAVEYVYTVQIADDETTQRVSTFYVDSVTKLPFWWQMRFGEKILFECDVSYPTTGPASIYDMNVPRSATNSNLPTPIAIDSKSRHSSEVAS